MITAAEPLCHVCLWARYYLLKCAFGRQAVYHLPLQARLARPGTIHRRGRRNGHSRNKSR
jgi:hypothetical protein